MRHVAVLNMILNAQNGGMVDQLARNFGRGRVSFFFPAGSGFIAVLLLRVRSPATHSIIV
jgi:hypothetical protein